MVGGAADGAGRQTPPNDVAGSGRDVHDAHEDQDAALAPIVSLL